MNAVTARILDVAGGVCVVNAGAAQTAWFREVTATHLPPGLAGPCMDAAAGDADGDGDLDLVLAMEFRPNVLLLNNGTGVFADGSDQLPRSVHDSEDVAFADFDQDGDLDLVFVSEDDRADELYINDGSGRFTDASARLPTDDVSNALAVLDLDGDGAPDLLTGNVGVNRVLINDGRGNFRDETAERWPQDGESRTQDLELADVDGDGDLDVVVGNEGQNQLFLNEEGRLVVAAGEEEAWETTSEFEEIDIDGDGTVDIGVTNIRLGDLPGGGEDRPAGAEAAAAREPGPTRSLQMADIDRDGDVDVIVSSTVIMEAAGDYLVLLNDGSGRFSMSSPGAVLPAAADGNGFDIEVADFDGDGIADLFFCNRASIAEPDVAADSGGLQRLLLGEPLRD